MQDRTNLLRRFDPRTAVALLGAVLMLAGCGKSASPDEDAKSPEPKTSAVKNVKPATRRKRSVAPQPPQTPDAAVKALLSGVRTKRPEAIWDFLPAGYQRDVADLIHLFGRKMDPELWSRTVAAGRRIVTLCRKRKAEILSSRAGGGLSAAGPQRLSADWDALLALADTILKSDLADLTKVKSLDVREFLKSTGGDALRQLARFSRLLPDDALQGELEQFADLDVTVVSSDAKTALVRLSLRSVAGASSTVSFVKVEGKWIPEGLAAHWKSGVEAVRKDLLSKLQPDVLRANKEKMLALLKGYEQELAALEAASTSEEFQTRFETSNLSHFVVALFRSASRSGAPAKPITPKTAGKQKTGPRRGVTVTVIVQGTLEDEKAEAIADKLFQLGNVDVGAHTTANDTTRFPVYSVTDFEAFRRKITFAQVVSADAAKREIVIRPK